MKKIARFFGVAASLLCACGGDVEQSPFVQFSLHQSGPITVRFGYVPGTETMIPLAIDGWAEGKPPVPIADFMCGNVGELFPNRACNIPRMIADMYRLEAQPPGGSYDDARIWQLAESMPGALTDARVVVVDGFPSFDPQLCKIDASCTLGRTTAKQNGRAAIAIFLPNLLTRAMSLRGGYPLSLYLGVMFAEIVTHELGHGAGLVNRDVGMVTPHEDTPGGTHCDNHSCIMASDPTLRTPPMWAAQRLALGPSADNGFDEHCVKDIRTASTY